MGREHDAALPTLVLWSMFYDMIHIIRGNLLQYLRCEQSELWKSQHGPVDELLHLRQIAKHLIHDSCLMFDVHDRTYIHRRGVW